MFIYLYGMGCPKLTYDYSETLVKEYYKNPELRISYRSKELTSENSKNNLRSSLVFGSIMPGRSFSSNAYRYGFGGYEKDDEVNGITGSHYTTQARPYDSRLGRWWSVDPKFKLQPGWSPYKAFLDNPILFQDPAGETEYVTIVMNDERTGKSTTITKVVSSEVFAGGVSQIDDGGGGWYNERSWYDRQTTITLNIGKEGKLTTSTNTKLVGSPRVTTSGPLMNSSTWANTWFAIETTEWDLPEGSGGVQEGGLYLTSEDGGASPTKFKSMTDAAMTDIGDFLTALGAMKSLSVTLTPKGADIVKDLVGLKQQKDEAIDQLKKDIDWIKSKGGDKEKKYICPYCNDTINESEKSGHPLGAEQGFEEIK